MDFYRLVRGFPRSMALAIASTLVSMLSVGLASMALFNFDLLHGIMLGAILGGTSSPIVISIVNRLSISQKTKTVLNLESILTDPLVIIISIALLNIIAQKSQISAVQGILSAFSIGAVIGLLAGIAWLFILDRLKGRQFDYMLTLAMLFLVYIFVEANGGSGAIASLIFGLVLGNSLAFSNMLKFRKKLTLNGMFRGFQAEISFFIRSFFFVFLGITFSAKGEFIIYGLAITAILVIMRVPATQLATIKMGLDKADINTIKIMAPRGLAAAVLAQYPQIFGIEGAGIFSSIASVVIIATVVYTSIAVRLVSGKRRGPKEAEAA